MTPPSRLALRSLSRCSLQSLHHPRPTLTSLTTTTTTTTPRLPLPTFRQAAPLHTSRSARSQAHNRFGEAVPDQPPPTDFARMDVLGQTPAPATSIDACLPDGFVLGDGSVTIAGGSGALLVAGEAFEWRPWDAAAGDKKKLVNAKGQWDLGDEEVLKSAFGLLSVVWPRPDLLILGLGPEMRPISPAVRKHISSLGIRIEIADTGNAASQFNLLATERGVDQVAAALIPIGWKEGVGAQ